MGLLDMSRQQPMAGPKPGGMGMGGQFGQSMRQDEETDAELKAAIMEGRPLTPDQTERLRIIYQAEADETAQKNRKSFMDNSLMTRGLTHDKASSNLMGLMAMTRGRRRR